MTLGIQSPSLGSRGSPRLCPPCHESPRIMSCYPGLYTEQASATEPHPNPCWVCPLYASVLLAIAGILGTRAHLTFPLLFRKPMLQGPSAFAGPVPWVCSGTGILSEEAGPPPCILLTTLLAAPPTHPALSPHVDDNPVQSTF